MFVAIVMYLINRHCCLLLLLLILLIVIMLLLVLSPRVLGLLELSSFFHYYLHFLIYPNNLQSLYWISSFHKQEKIEIALQTSLHGNRPMMKHMIFLQTGFMVPQGWNENKPSSLFFYYFFQNELCKEETLHLWPVKSL